MRILIGVAKIWTSVTQIWKHLCKKIIITLKFGIFPQNFYFRVDCTGQYKQVFSQKNARIFHVNGSIKERISKTSLLNGKKNTKSLQI